MDIAGEAEEDYFQQISDDLSSSDTPTEDLPGEVFDFKKRSPFQKEIIFNKLLPYADKLDDEADALLIKIKTNLGRCVMLRKIKPDCIVWSNVLHKYMILYDLRFTKEDHITFIKLMYELMTIPNLESSLIGAFGYRLHLLLRKIDLISPEELQLPWRPLYDLFFHVVAQKPMQITFYHHPSSLRSLLESIIHSAKIYFPVTATQEILDELRPQICPFIPSTMQMTMKSLELFLPTQRTPNLSSLGYELWFHELMKLWEVCSSNSHTWGDNVMGLMAKLAFHNIGYIDWEPYMPLMFTRFVQSFNLPVCYKKTRCNSTCKISPYSIASWIAAVLGRNSSTQLYLDKFLKSIETYFHPANYGSWLKKLAELYVEILFYVVTRINKERNVQHWKPTWKAPIPESHKLTDADIDAFVNSMMPIAMISIFNKRCSHIFYDALHYLAVMRPNVVIPKILEKVYPTLDSDIEPHKLITALNCMVAVSRPLVQGSRTPDKAHAFQEGPLQVMPLLFASLSGIDPNDPNKVSATFRLIATYVTMIPIVDCSKTTAELNEDDRVMSAETSRFEDFILQFMDKVFIWIDSSSVETVRLENNTNGNGNKSRSEAMAETALSRVFLSLLKQCSRSIFLSALNKLKSFIVEHVLETQVAGQLVAVLCKVFSSVDSHETLKALFPFLSEKVLDAIGEGDEVIIAENLDNHLLYPLLLLNRMVLTRGDALLPYMDTLIKVIDKVILLKSREGNLLGCFTLSNVLQSLANPSSINVERDLDDPTYPYIRDWGETVKILSVKVKMYTAGEEEYSVLQTLFTRYFMPVVASIENFIKTENSLSRDDLQVTLRIIYNILDGCEAVLPFWDEPQLKIKPYDECLEPFDPVTCSTKGEVTMPDGSNVRLYLVKLMTDLQEIMLKTVEDDTKSLIILQLIWQSLLLGKLRTAIDSCFKFSTNYSISKKFVENKIIGNNGWFPLIVLARVNAQHQIRKMVGTPVLTETHKKIIMNLLKLSTSQYSRIRMRAQDTIQIALGYFPSAHVLLVPYIIEMLQRDPTLHHDAYKGILYLLTRKINHQDTLLVKPDWEFIKTIWPALVLSQPSEKPSVIRLKDNIVDIVMDTFYTTNLRLEIPDTCILLASNFWNTNEYIPNKPQPTELEVQKGMEDLKQRGENDVKKYNELLDELLIVLLEKNLHWRHRLMAMNFIYVLIHPEEVYSPQHVRFFLNALINESIEERKVALRVIMYIFKQLKKKYIKVKIDVPSKNEISSNPQSQIQPGCRPDNKWLQYNYDTRPTNSKEWDKPRYVHRTNVGYYAWPRELLVHAGSSDQPTTNKDSPTPHEIEINEFFSDQQNIDKLLKYLSLEGKKGRDKFSNARFIIFKGLFRNHGDIFLDKFLPHLKTFVQDKQESVQRCAAEIICGLIKGSKHWTYEMTERMWEHLLPILRSALSNLTVETITDWAVGITNVCKDRDPNRLHWLLECLMEESPLGQSEASFVECGRLTILQGALVTMSWRVTELQCRLLLHFENRFEESPFQNVRDRLASTLVTIFRSRLKFGPEDHTDKSLLEVKEFIDKIYPRLQSLLEENESSTLLLPKVTDLSLEEPPKSPSSPNVIDPIREKNARLLKTVCRWILETVMISNLDSLSSFYKIYPIMSQLENNEKDEELSVACTRSVAVLALTITLPEHVPAVLEAVRKVSESSSWSARASCLDFLQVLVFHNMSILLSEKKWIITIEDIVLRLLEDERLEVREKAAQMLGGLLHCTIIPDQETLLEDVKKKAKTKVGKKKRKSTADKEEAAENAKLVNAARLRHAGVLGMCAFIQAHPYDVPKHVPPIFECLSSHLNDPEPIPSTIRKTLNDFKRTHCDGWTGLQGLADYFTEEQFAVMQDLTVPPSYYA